MKERSLYNNRLSQDGRWGNETGKWYTKEEALAAYNRAVTPVLPIDTEVIDNHKIQ